MTATTTRSVSRLSMDDRVAKLRHAVENAPGNHYCNIIIAQVDPDAMGSAFGMAEILQALNKETAIWFTGGMSHPQNRILYKRFNLAAEMQHIGNFRPIIEMRDTGITEMDGVPVEDCGYEVASVENNFVLVDSNRARDSRLPYPLEPFVVADHHKESDLDSEETLRFFDERGFLWLDEGAGSASTMITELLHHFIDAGLMPENWEMTEKLATLLAMGIYSDTKNLVSAGKRDHEAFNWLSHWTNESTFSMIIDYEFDESFLKNLETSLGNRKHHNAHLLSGMGIVEAEDADDLSTVCDLFLRKAGVNIAITWGGVRFVDDKTGEETIKLRVCARSRAKQLPDGRGEGGAMFELVFDLATPEELMEIVDRRLREWLFDEEVEA